MSPQQIEVHVFYVALGYLISYSPCALLTQALLGGDDPWSYRLMDGIALLPAVIGPLPHLLPDSEISRLAVTALDDHRYIAAQIQQSDQRWLSERFL